MSHKATQQAGISPACVFNPVVRDSMWRLVVLSHKEGEFVICYELSFGGRIFDDSFRKKLQIKWYLG